MKFLRILVLADAAFLMFLGFGMVLPIQPFPAVYPAGKQYETIATLRVLGTGLGGLAIVVLVTATLSLLGNYRQFALWLSCANVLLAVMTGIQQKAIWGSTVGWFLFLIPLVLGAALAWVGLRPLKPGEAAAELATLRMPEEIRQVLLRQIGEAAAQEERNRLARDLHDSIKQQLFSINVGTAAAQERWERDPEGARAMLADVRRSAKEAMVEMQALLHQLRPEALGSVKGLIEALREQCEALGYRSGSQVTVELGEEILDDRLPPGALEALFRIAQEALANVARHARARNVRVWLGREGEAALLQVEDDGQGFNPGEKTPGMGLRNLRERAESLDGTLQITSAPGAGTTVTVSLLLTPLPSAEISAIETDLDQAVADLFITALLVWVFLWMTPPETPYYFGTTLVALLLGSAAWNWARRARKVPRAVPVDVSRLRHARDRSRAFDLCVAACWAFYIWSFLQNGWSAGWIAWGATALLCTVLAGLELTRYHRQSRFRSDWPKWIWSSLHRRQSSFFASLRKYQKTSFVFALLFIQFVLKSQHLTKLGPKQLLCFSVIGAALVYLFIRQHRIEEAAA